MTAERKTWLVTGGAGFIGVNFVKMLADDASARVVVLDALTYAGNLASLQSELDSGTIDFIKGDIGCSETVDSVLNVYKPSYIVNFAAESHVDRSVDNPRPFVETNVLGTQTLLECARRYVQEGGKLEKFVQVSTDEVYGDLEIDFEEAKEDAAASALIGRPVKLYGHEVFAETSAIKPSSPYSASKAAADMMALAYRRTYGLPVVVTRCSNNYGPYQFPEKLIPLMINNIVEHRPLPVYGKGANIRDWIYVADHCRGVALAAEKGVPGQIYNFGGYSEVRNIDLVRRLVDAVTGNKPGVAEELITFVKDRPGHDRRYAIDASKAVKELGWKPEVNFDEGLARTVEWYLANRNWTENIVGGEYRDYYDKMYTNR